MPQSIIFLTYITHLSRGRDAMDFRISIDRHQQLLWWNSTGGLQTQHQDEIIWLVKPCSKKLLYHFLDGGPGWTRTNNRINHLIYSQGRYHLRCTDPYNALSNIHPTSILTAYRRIYYSSFIYNTWMFPCLSWKQSLCRHKQLRS